LQYSRHLTAYSTPYCPISWAHTPNNEENPSFNSNTVLQQNTIPHKTFSRNTSNRPLRGQSSTTPNTAITNQQQCPDNQLQNGSRKKHGRWKHTTKQKQPKQTTIRKFIVTQPRLFDYGFLKPQGEVNDEDPDT
jgi:hypothetical protein